MEKHTKEITTEPGTDTLSAMSINVFQGMNLNRTEGKMGQSGSERYKEQASEQDVCVCIHTSE